jgi:branched-chain amino acid transport system permease protein
MIAREPRPVLLLVACVASLALLPFVFPAYPRFVATIALLNTIAVVGLGLVMGYAGLVSLGHAGFVAVGAYTAALLVAKASYPFWVSLPLGIAAATAIGFVVGLPTLRLNPLYLAMVTFGFGQSVFLIALNWVSLTRGANGLRIPPPRAFGVTVGPDAMYWIVAAAAVLAVVTAYRITRTRPGRAFMALRESEIAAVVAGVNPRAYKTMAFGLSAAYAGLAGALYVGVVLFINPDSFVFPVSLMYVTMAVVGGMGTLAGIIVGAVVLTILPEWLRGFAEYRELLAGGMLLSFLVFLPQGIAGFVRQRQGGSRRLLVSRGASATAYALPSWDSDGRENEAKVGDGRERLLRVENVRKSFGGVHALRGVNLQVVGGTIHGLIGPNGSGKTTLFNVITRLYEPDEGTVWFENANLLTVPAFSLAELGVARTFQNLELFTRLTVLENVLIGMHSHIPVSLTRAVLGKAGTRRLEEEARQRAMGILHFVGFEGDAGQPAGTLPFGHQRLVEIARALASRPKILLLDEPSSGLTLRGVEALGEAIQRIRAELGITIVLVAHTMRLVLGVCDVVSVLDHGEKIAEGVPDAVRMDPDVIRAYLGDEGEPTGGSPRHTAGVGGA